MFNAKSRLVAAAVTSFLLLPVGMAVAQDANTVVIKNFDFSPMSLTVKPGTTVTWKNADGEPHTVTSVDGLFRSGALDTDETFAFRYDRPGVYKYVCSIHPRMTGTITVR